MTATSGVPVSARRLQTRQRLMDAAAGVFAERGIEGASVEEISEAAGFTRGAFYSNFDSKDDLCFALLRWIAERFLDSVRATVERIGEKPGTGDDASADREALIDLAVDTFLAIQPQERHTMLLLMEMQLYALRHPDFAAAYAAHITRTHRVFAEVLDEVLSQRGLALSLPADQVVDILHGVHDYTQASGHLHPERAYPLASQLKILLNALVRASGQD